MTEVQIKPVRVSGNAHRALAEMTRQWSGWPKARLVLGETEPEVSPYAMTDFSTRTITVDPDRLVLNPNRVINTVTPFRLRQEGVLTGALIHEAAHARYSTWIPRNAEDAAKFKHGDGTDVSQPVMKFALCMEEPRIEGLMARDSHANGLLGLEWTMRASAAQLLPFTDVSSDPDQMILDVIQSWTLRAGRQWALQHWTDYAAPQWAYDFGNFLNQCLFDHFDRDGRGDDKYALSRTVIDSLMLMIKWGTDVKTLLVDVSRDVLRILFPETEDDDLPQMGGSCAGGGGQDQGQETQGAPEQGDQGSGGSEAQPEGDEPSEGDSGNQEGDTDSKPGLSEVEQQALEQALANVEAAAQITTEAETKAEAGEQPGGVLGGKGTKHNLGGGWRSPSAEEREVGKQAERFLRNLIDPTEASKVTLSDSPSSDVDGAALAEWKAGGQHTDPLFFRRTRRAVEPAPPVKIAVLVDISSSMSQLQKPSALLSWALASAAFDLRNFAGRGRQIESCLIHWGDDAHVVQRNGDMIPGIREVACDEGTTAMDAALDLVAEQIPGFFDVKDRPESRLLVQFTDWKIFGMSHGKITEQVRQALSVGVNMLTVFPDMYSKRQGMLPSITERFASPGRSSTMTYNSNAPSRVWDEATRLIQG